MRAGVISWQLAQTFWVGGLWLLQFVMLPALAKIGLAPLLIEEVAGSLQPLLVSFTASCVLLQALVLIQLCGLRSLWRDLRGQLLLAVLLLAGIHLAARAGIIESPYWLIFSYLAMGMCGLILVLQVAPGRER
ncbi:DUF4149 domain-containing protein [Stutzerimonas xanthomarina]|uniref:DUF4149 domain-containing protein n=1 Tax=Stutzerimonas xanthomarina TaxID=271420 RepID=UPI003AA8A472